MNLIDKIALVGQRMKSEQISLKESLLVSSRVSVSDDSVEGVDRLIYNHCLNKKICQIFLASHASPLIKSLPILKIEVWLVLLSFRTKTISILWDVQKSWMLWAVLGTATITIAVQS